MDMKTDSSGRQTIKDICADVFSLILYLRESSGFEDSDLLYNKILGLFTAVEQKLRDSNLTDADIKDTRYALAAFIDETAGWASRLELEFFGSNVAGEEFFTRFDQMKESGLRHDVLEIYYTCLVLGFEGKYVRTPERLQEHIRDFQRTLQSKSIQELSPHGERPKETISHRRGGMPSWLPWAAMAGGAVIAGVILILLKVQINGWAENVINQVQRFLH